MTKSTISFFVPGDPKGQPRARAFALKRGGQTFVRMYDPATAEGWKNAIASVAKPFIPQTPADGPVEVCFGFVFSRPKSHYGTGKNASNIKPTAPAFHISKPDLDNLEKAVFDCLTTLGFWTDDSQICGSKVSKRYTITSGEPGGCFVEIRYL